ncbi:NUDIX domain-containing protein [Pseudoalteromonas sp. OF7H-1]|uniref:NUDIX hydrolase n=1 Tax=Pseudoalteromonas sp. OF7H-1 TaxID=2917755 RepID=UPI001EF6487F|nr:NUDIX domain-containing protein [Pseudoalteromonas sp. OF7H-1]MCG7541837.1 NUDIX domain-containing protein [Pseudoalteromonas sp. OF7H-1]
MQSLNNTPVIPLQGSCFTRKTTRAIVLRGNDILMLYTKRYDDYTLPGGGVDEGESLEAALERELKEETGAVSITELTPFGRYEEYRPWYKPGHDNVHIISYCYVCEICGEFDAPAMEDYERANGMKPVWININQAIAHNEAKLNDANNKGMSVLRELTLLKHISAQLVTD